MSIRDAVQCEFDESKSLRVGSESDAIILINFCAVPSIEERGSRASRIQDTMSIGHYDQIVQNIRIHISIHSLASLRERPISHTMMIALQPLLYRRALCRLRKASLKRIGSSSRVGRPLEKMPGNRRAGKALPGPDQTKPLRW